MQDGGGGQQPAEQGRSGEERFGEDAQEQPGVEQTEGGPGEALAAAGTLAAELGEHPIDDADDELRDPADHEQVEVDRIEGGDEGREIYELAGEKGDADNEGGEEVEKGGFDEPAGQSGHLVRVHE